MEYEESFNSQWSVVNIEIWKDIEEVEEKYNIKTSGISACCRGDRKSAGKHPITGEKMVWKYID